MALIKEQALLEATSLLSTEHLQAKPLGARTAAVSETPATTPAVASSYALNKMASRIEQHLLRKAVVAELGARANRGKRKLFEEPESEDVNIVDDNQVFSVSEADDGLDDEPEGLQGRQLLRHRRRHSKHGRRTKLGRPTFNATRPTAAEALPYCSLQQNVGYYDDGQLWGGIIPGTASYGDCCAACFFRLDCFAWSIAPNMTCYMFGKRYSTLKRSLSVGWVSGVMSPEAAWVAPPSPPPFAPLLTGSSKYLDALKLSVYFFEAQRSGYIPNNYVVPWRKSAHMSDLVPGGWYDAGNFLKANFPLGTTVSFLAWSMIRFPKAYRDSRMTGTYLKAMQVATDYLLNCYDERRQTYVGQIGNLSSDNWYWGRPEDQNFTRTAYVYDKSMKASDLYSSASAAYASASIIYRRAKPKYSRLLLSKAISMYNWAISAEGVYTDYYKQATYPAYPGGYYLDHQSWAAAWLYVATRDGKYLNDAASFWRRSYGKNPQQECDIFPGWASLWAPVSVLMRQISRTGVNVPGIDMYNAYYEDWFFPAWTKADTQQYVTITPKGMSYPTWNQWGNLQFSTTTAMIMLQDTIGNPNRKMIMEEIAYAQRNTEYALGLTGRSYVVGFGNQWPVNWQHEASSCPDMPAVCDLQNLYEKAPNPQLLKGAMVGGPAGARRYPSNPDYYFDIRTDYGTGEPALDYQAGFVGAIAGLYYHG